MIQLSITKDEQNFLKEVLRLYVENWLDDPVDCLCDCEKGVNIKNHFEVIKSMLAKVGLEWEKVIQEESTGEYTRKRLVEFIEKGYYGDD